MTEFLVVLSDGPNRSRMEIVYARSWGNAWIRAHRVAGLLGMQVKSVKEPRRIPR